MVNSTSLTNPATPLVSVIVPSYNHEKFLALRLSNISQQTYSNIEIIILDDASEDNSQFMLKQYSESEPRVKHLVVNQTNSGQPVHQWSKGLELTLGKYVWFAESDDYNDVEFVSTMVKLMDANPRSGIAYCSSSMVDSTNQLIGKFDLESPLFPEDLWKDNFVIEGNKLVAKYFPVRNIIPNANGALFNRALLAKHIDSGKTLRYLADWMIYVNIALDSDIIYINSPLNFYRIHDKSTTRSYSIAKHYKIIRERIQILKTIKQKIYSGEHVIKEAVTYMMLNRNKFRRAEKLFQKLRLVNTGSNNIAFYAYNDLAKYLMERDGDYIVPRFIIDEGKAGNKYNNVAIVALTEADLTQIKTVVVLSLRYANEMVSALKEKGFSGNVTVI